MRILLAWLQKEARVDLTHDRAALAWRAHDDLQAGRADRRGTRVGQDEPLLVDVFLVRGRVDFFEDERHGR
jgi:hypothetical protein